MEKGNVQCSMFKLYFSQKIVVVDNGEKKCPYLHLLLYFHSSGHYPVAIWMKCSLPTGTGKPRYHIFGHPVACFKHDIPKKLTLQLSRFLQHKCNDLRFSNKTTTFKVFKGKSKTSLQSSEMRYLSPNLKLSPTAVHWLTHWQGQVLEGAHRTKKLVEKKCYRWIGIAWRSFPIDY